MSSETSDTPAAEDAKQGEEKTTTETKTEDAGKEDNGVLVDVKKEEITEVKGEGDATEEKANDATATAKDEDKAATEDAKPAEGADAKAPVHPADADVDVDAAANGGDPKLLKELDDEAPKTFPQVVSE
jgi:hypothetical protein